MKINKDDQGKLIAAGFLVFIVLACFLVAKVFKMINPLVTLGITVIAQYLLLMPAIMKLYYKANGAKAGFDRFIPLWNELSVFTPKGAIITLISWVALLIAGLMTFFDISRFQGKLSDAAIFNYGDVMLRVTIGLYVLNNIIRGIYLVQLGSTIRQLNTRLYQFRKTKWGLISSILTGVACFIPIIRVTTFAMYYNTLTRLVVLNKMGKEQLK